MHIAICPIICEELCLPIMPKVHNWNSLIFWSIWRVGGVENNKTIVNPPLQIIFWKEIRHSALQEKKAQIFHLVQRLWKTMYTYTIKIYLREKRRLKKNGSSSIQCQHIYSFNHSKKVAREISFHKLFSSLSRNLH